MVVEKLRECGLEKGYKLYLDNFHKNHLEVFDALNRIKNILNIDGTLNADKLEKTAGRILR